MNQDKFTVVLGDYKNVERPHLDATVTEEEIMSVLNHELQKHVAMETVDAPAQNGDTVVIDFAGFLGDEQFEGGTSEGYSLKLGSGSFIPGFEEQLIGAKAGDEVDVNVSFPENYHAANLAGKPVVFKCKVHAVQQERKAELNDAFVQKTYNIPSVDALKNVIRTNIQSQKLQQNTAKVQQAVLMQIIEKSEITVSEEFINDSIEELLGFFQQNLAQQGVSLEQYCQMSGMTLKIMREQLRPQAVDRAKGAAVLTAIAEAEGLDVSDEEYASELEAMAQAYQMPVEALKAQLPENARQEITANMLINRAMALIAG